MPNFLNDGRNRDEEQGILENSKDIPKLQN